MKNPWVSIPRSMSLVRGSPTGGMTSRRPNHTHPPVRRTSAAAAAVAAGCDDPLVLYYRLQLDFAAGRAGPDDYLKNLRPIVAALWASEYPDVRKVYAVHNFLAALAGPGRRGPADEVRVWDARYWEAFGRVCRDPDLITQGEVIELAHIREEYLTGAGETREKAYEEVAARLAAADAPDYTRLVVKGSFLIRHGWDARGSGTAGTVTPEGFELLGRRMVAAQEALEAAYDLDPDRPHAPSELIFVCIGRGHPRAEMEKWFAAAMTADPDHMKACTLKLEYLHPKWYGDLDDYLGFGWQCVRTENTAGMLAYAPVNHMLLNDGGWDPMTPAVRARLQSYYSYRLIWQTVDSALGVVLRDRPEKTRLLGLRAKFACVCGRYEVARRDLVDLGGNYRDGRFASEKEFELYREWAKTGRLPGGGE